MRWSGDLADSVLQDLRWFGKRVGRLLLDETVQILPADPLAQTNRLKTLRPNRYAQRELRLRGKCRILFKADEAAYRATVLLVGEKKGNALLVRGKEFTAHHESRPAE